MLPVAESETLFPDSVTHHPKVVLAGGSVDSPRPQNLVQPLENGITKDPEGSPRFENVCQCFSDNLRSPSAS
jgi:hypothetical protein